jgi:hypothetical protein
VGERGVEAVADELEWSAPLDDVVGAGDRFSPTMAS